MTSPDRMARLAGLAALGFQRSRLTLLAAQRDLQAHTAQLADHRARQRDAAAEQDPATAALAARYRLWLAREEARLIAACDRAQAVRQRRIAAAARDFGRARAAETLAEKHAQAARRLAERRAEAALPPSKPIAARVLSRSGNAPLKPRG